MISRKRYFNFSNNDSEIHYLVHTQSNDHPK